MRFTVRMIGLSVDRVQTTSDPVEAILHGIMEQWHVLSPHSSWLICDEYDRFVALLTHHDQWPNVAVTIWRDQPRSETLVLDHLDDAGVYQGTDLVDLDAPYGELAESLTDEYVPSRGDYYA